MEEKFISQTTDNGFRRFIQIDVSVYIGCAFSIAGLIVTIITFIIVRKTRSSRNQQALLNLSVALLFTYVTFVSGIQGGNNFTACLIVALLLHYFTLVSFIWMLIHGILLYLDIVKVFFEEISFFLLKSMISAWVVPAVFVGIIVNIDHTWYVGGNKNLCWMDMNISNYVFRLPVGIILFINFTIYIRISLELFCKKSKIRQAQNKSYLATKIRAAVCMMFLMGLTWIFTIFTIANIHPVFSYLLSIFNLLQGFFIFLFRYLAIYDQPEWEHFITKICKTRKVSSISNIRIPSSSSSSKKIKSLPKAKSDTEESAIKSDFLGETKSTIKDIQNNQAIEIQPEAHALILPTDNNDSNV